MPDDGFPPLFSGINVRQQPTNIAAEQAFLGALFRSNKVLEKAFFLKPVHFADAIHRQIYERSKALIEGGRVADALTLKQDFENSGVLSEVGGTAYLVNLISAAVGIINAADYARVIFDLWQRRRLIEIGEDMVNSAFGQMPGIAATEIAREASGFIDDISAGNDSEYRVTTLDAAMDSALDAMEAARRRQGPAGISTGFKVIDDRIGGLEPGLVYVLAGRPGMGKSALGHQIALNAARHGVGVMELSLEMSAMQLGRRALSAFANVSQFNMKTGFFTNDHAARLVKARQELAGLPLTIDDAGGQTPAMIAAKARHAKRKHGLGLLMIDHLNLMKADEADAKHGGTWATGRASNTVLQIAKECECPVLLLAQLNRGPENREDKRPTLADLRQAGDIEQDAYAVGFVYRGEYYLSGKPEMKEGETPGKHQERTQAWDDRKQALAGKAEIIWAKVRDGEPGSDELTFDGPTTSFGE